MGSSREWLEKALVDLCKRVETGLDFDGDVISGLVSYCEHASPLDAKDYLDNIIGEETGKHVIAEYMQRRGHSEFGGSTSAAPTSKLHAYIKPPSDQGLTSGTKKPLRASKAAGASNNQVNQVLRETSDSKSSQEGHQVSSKKKKSGKAITLAEAAKGSIVFQQGKPCSCQALRHRLVSNCLSCGKIVCEQEGEGPCNFCGALVLKEGSSYAGLEDGVAIPLSDSEVAAEAYAKRLVEYDRNSAARTAVIDDQSDYYEIEGNSWLSVEERELLMKKREEIEEAEKAKRNKVVMTFDLFGRKVLLNEAEVSELQSDNSIVRPLEQRDIDRIKPNPNLRVKPIFVDPGPTEKTVKGKQQNKGLTKGLCLEITGRVQHDGNELKHFMIDNQQEKPTNEKPWQGPSANGGSYLEDNNECSLDYN